MSTTLVERAAGFVPSKSSDFAISLGPVLLTPEEPRGNRLVVRVNGEERELAVTGVFVAIGHIPNTTLVIGQVDLEENGYVRTGLGSFTNIDGLFAAGDVQDHVYRQAVTSAGSGCIAAIDAERWLEAQGH